MDYFFGSNLSLRFEQLLIWHPSCAVKNGIYAGTATMGSSFLDLLKRHGIEGPLPRWCCGGPAAQGVKPERGKSNGHKWDFAFATGIECSNHVPILQSSTQRVGDCVAIYCRSVATTTTGARTCS
jgi:hypothetical protein